MDNNNNSNSNIVDDNHNLHNFPLLVQNIYIDYNTQHTIPYNMPTLPISILSGVKNFHFSVKNLKTWLPNDKESNNDPKSLVFSHTPKHKDTTNHIWLSSLETICAPLSLQDFILMLPQLHQYIHQKSQSIPFNCIFTNCRVLDTHHHIPKQPIQRYAYSPKYLLEPDQIRLFPIVFPNLRALDLSTHILHDLSPLAENLTNLLALSLSHITILKSLSHLSSPFKTVSHFTISLIPNLFNNNRTEICQPYHNANFWNHFDSIFPRLYTDLIFLQNNLPFSDIIFVPRQPYPELKNSTSFALKNPYFTFLLCAYRKSSTLTSSTRGGSGSTASNLPNIRGNTSNAAFYIPGGNFTFLSSQKIRFGTISHTVPFELCINENYLNLKYPFLKVLKITFPLNLSHWSTSGIYFPSVETLNISHICGTIPETLDSILPNLHKLIFQTPSIVPDEIIAEPLQPLPNFTSSTLSSITSRVHNLKSISPLFGNHLSNLHEFSFCEAKYITQFPDLDIPSLTRLNILRTNIESFATTQTKKTAINGGVVFGSKLTALKHFAFQSNHKFVRFPDVYLPNLSSLKLHFCDKLEYVPCSMFSSISQLSELSITCCPKLEDIPSFTSLPDCRYRLTSISCYKSNFIRSESFNDFYSLKTIDFHGCSSLETLSLCNVPRLTLIDIARTPIKSFDLQNNNDHHSLDNLGVDSLQTLSLSKCIRLQTLHNLSSHSLHTLKLTKSGLSSFPPGFGKNLPMLKALLVEYTFNLNHLPNFFAKSLLRINLNYSALQSIDHQFSSLSLKSLNLNGTFNLSMMPNVHCPSLEYLNISNSGLTTIDPQFGSNAHLSNLKVLKLNNTPNLTILPNLQCPSLTTLEMKNCGISSIDAKFGQYLTNLEQFLISCPNLKIHLPHWDLPCLSILDICKTPILSIPAQFGLKSPLLSIFRLRNLENIETLPSLHLPNLTNLNIKRSLFVKLESQTLPSLTHLNLSFTPKLVDIAQFFCPKLHSVNMARCPWPKLWHDSYSYSTYIDSFNPTSSSSKTSKHNLIEFRKRNRHTYDPIP